MTSMAAMGAESASVERLQAAAAATMEKARYCWAMTVADDGSVLEPILCRRRRFEQGGAIARRDRVEGLRPTIPPA